MKYLKDEKQNEKEGQWGYMMQSTELYDPDHLLRDCVPSHLG